MMNLKIDYSKEISYPPMMQDIIRQLCILEKEFTEITIWYGDGFDHVIYADEDSKISFRETYLLEETSYDKCIYIPYDKIYEIIINFQEKK